MAVMGSFPPESLTLEQKAQPVPSEMALDIEINGHSKHDEQNREASIPDHSLNGIKTKSIETNDAPMSDPREETVASLGETNGVTETPNADDSEQRIASVPEIAPSVSEEGNTSAMHTQSATGDVKSKAQLESQAESQTLLLSQHATATEPEKTDLVIAEQPPLPATSTLPIIEQQQSDVREDPLPDPKVQPEQVDSTSPESVLVASTDLATQLPSTLPASTDATMASNEVTTSHTQDSNLTASPQTSENQEKKVDVDSRPAPQPETSLSASPSLLKREEEDTKMADAPASPNLKKARERDEDDEESRSAKRAKLEGLDASAQQTTTPDAPMASNGESQSIAATPTAGSSVAGSPGPPSSGFDDALKPTEYQLKETLKIVRAQKSSKHGRNFKDAVAKLWPQLAEQYSAKVSDPIDLQIIDTKLKEASYDMVGDIKADLRRLYDNCVLFNGPDHVVTVSASIVRDLVISKIPSSAAGDRRGVARPVAPKRITPKPDGAARVPSQNNRRRSAGAAAMPANGAASGPAFALNPDGNPIIRRDSTKVDGRPQRQIHAPKARDITYNARPKKKKYVTEMKFCDHVLGELKKPKYIGHSSAFLQPVDPVALHIPEYFKIIKNPMDISTIEEKLTQGQYEKAKEFEDDFRLIFKNCFKFNPAGTPVYEMGQGFEQDFNIEWAKKGAFLVENGEPQAASPTDFVSDEEEESEEEEEVEEASPEPEAREALTSRLVEEQNKLITLMSAKKPDTIGIEMQKQMISFLQEKIAEESAKPSAKSVNKKKPKPVKKPVKVPAPKTKKAAGSKPYKVRNIGTAEKEVISQGIGTLDENEMAQAIKLLKFDFPNLNVEDEIEFDIDQFSATTLSKLYELITKTHPDLIPEKKAPSKANTSKPAKQKKNKPMSKYEQESKIAQLNKSLGQFKRSESHSENDKSNVQQSIEHEEEQSSGDDESSDSEED